MKILQLIPNIASGGGERFTVDLSNELSKNHSVTLLTLYNENETDLFRGQLDTKVQTVTLGKHVGFDWKVIVRLYRALNKLSPDVIQTHLRAFNYLMSIIPLLRNIPVIHTIHNDAFKECSNNKIRKVRKLFFKRPNIVPVTISEESAKSFDKAYKGLENKLIYNGREAPKKVTNMFRH